VAVPCVGLADVRLAADFLHVREDFEHKLADAVSDVAFNRVRQRDDVLSADLQPDGGVAFIVLHAREWLHLIGEGVRPWSNPWGAPQFGAAFFGLTGLHMFHVFSGVIYLGVIAFGVGRGRRTHEDVEICGLYWHFVDLVWMFIFPLIYLMSVARP
jgi:hypothetical protein